MARSQVPTLLLSHGFKAAWILTAVLVVAGAVRADSGTRFFEMPGAFRELTRPTTLASADVKTLDPESLVLGVVRKGQARAYPLRVVSEHRIVNDVLQGPLLVTWDVDSESARAFIAEYRGQPLTFTFQGWHLGVMVLRDQQTGSLWSHLTGISLAGTARGTQLVSVPVVASSWKTWRQMNPDSSVLDCDYQNRYGREPEPALLSDEASRSLNPPDERLPAEVKVLGIAHEGAFKAYRIDQLTGLRVDHLAGNEVAIFRDATGETAAFRTDVGGRRLKLEPRTIEGVTRLVDQEGTVFDLGGRALGGSNRSLVPVDAVETRWYAWAAYHPQTLIEGVPCVAGEHHSPVLLPLPKPRVSLRDDLRQKKETQREARRAIRRNREAGRQ